MGDESGGGTAMGDESGGGTAMGDESGGGTAKGDESGGGTAKGDESGGGTPKGDDSGGGTAKGDESGGGTPKGDDSGGGTINGVECGEATVMGDDKRVKLRKKRESEHNMMVVKNAFVEENELSEDSRMEEQWENDVGRMGDEISTVNLRQPPPRCPTQLIIFCLLRQTLKARKAVMNGRPVQERGRPPILYEDEKNQLVEEILELNDIGVYPTYHEISLMVKTISDKRESLVHRDVDPPSRSWVSEFVKQEPRRKGSKPTVLAQARIAAQTKSHIRPFYEMLQRLDDPVAYPPALRVNFDETSLLASQAVISFRVGPSTRKEVFVKPINQIFSCTVVFFTCADGRNLRTHLILPDKFNISEIQERDDDGMVIHFSQKGWMTKEVLSEILLKSVKLDILEKKERRHFPPEARSLLLFDGHSSRRNPDLWLELASYGIDAVCLPPNVSAWCQPNDIYVNANFKAELISMDPLPSKTKLAAHLPKWLDKLESKIQRSLTIDSTKASFKDSGVFPVNMDVVCQNWSEGTGSASTSRCFDITCKLLGSAEVQALWRQDIAKKTRKSPGNELAGGEEREQARNFFLHSESVDVSEITEVNSNGPDLGEPIEMTPSPINSRSASSPSAASARQPSSGSTPPASQPSSGSSPSVRQLSSSSSPLARQPLATPSPSVRQLSSSSSPLARQPVATPSPSASQPSDGQSDVLISVGIK
ncbi:hypothetical protein BLNAU_22310 [Blattamonas nauphoetae]|uniref:DDE-1 domain-containing protein n=1 Tax=Blattamonas nauphoetae TaxID=2049346 RepID=A0ABQ9WVP6_9EUKA|nr:hypothetical protein BLNAU_22310 [Blattamonas nauphoetae]